MEHCLPPEIMSSNEPSGRARFFLAVAHFAAAAVVGWTAAAVYRKHNSNKKQHRINIQKVSFIWPKAPRSTGATIWALLQSKSPQQSPQPYKTNRDSTIGSR